MLAKARRSVVPSDFRFHNSIRRPTGRWRSSISNTCGWDDPCEAWCRGVAPQRVVALIACAAGSDPSTAAVRPTTRKVLEPHYYTPPIWPEMGCLFVLNEFLPRRCAHRQLAGATDSWEAHQTTPTRACARFGKPSPGRMTGEKSMAIAREAGLSRTLQQMPRRASMIAQNRCAALWCGAGRAAAAATSARQCR